MLDVLCERGHSARIIITRYSDSNTSPQWADAVDFDAVGSVPLAHIVYFESTHAHLGLQLP